MTMSAARRRTLNYILDGNGEPIPCGDLLQWAEWMHSASRHVAKDLIGEVLISTVFLGHDHAFTGPPILWETMIFGGPHDQYQSRYRSRVEALEGHARALAMVKGKPA